jgi:Tfp pilus assembly protein PilE
MSKETKDFSKNTIEGQQNLKVLKDLKKRNRTSRFFYFLIFLCSFATSGYGSWVAGSILGGILIFIIEIIRWVSMQPFNRLGVIIATIFSVTTASTSGWLFHQAHNKTANNNTEIIKELEQERDSITTTDINSQTLLNVQDKVQFTQEKLNSVLTRTYRIKQWSRTRKLTGLQIKSIKNCGKSTRCKEVQATIHAYKQELESYNQQKNLVKIGLKEAETKQQRYQQIQDRIVLLKQQDTKIVFPLIISLLIIIMLIFSIDYGLWLTGGQIAKIKPELELYIHAYNVWKIQQAEERKAAKNKGKTTTEFAKNAIIPSRYKRKNQLDSDEKIKQVIKSMTNAKAKFTLENAKEHLQILGFGKTGKNAKTVIDFYKQQEVVANEV